MKKIYILVMCIILAGCAGTISPIGQQRVVIRNDRGGLINNYIAKYKRWAAQDKLVVVDGYCASACTTAIGLIPRHNLCVTRNAVWGFHGSYTNTLIVGGAKTEAPTLTHLMTDTYTHDVQAWIDRHGGIKTYKRMLLMKYPETLNYFRAC